MGAESCEAPELCKRSVSDALNVRSQRGIGNLCALRSKASDLPPTLCTDGCVEAVGRSVIVQVGRLQHTRILPTQKHMKLKTGTRKRGTYLNDYMTWFQECRYLAGSYARGRWIQDSLERPGEEECYAPEVCEW